jgi:hypothetical protein
MPALKNVKWEAFARHIALSAKTGASLATCYRESGYHCVTDRAAETAASRLSKNVEIQARVAEINAPAVRKVGITQASLLEDISKTVVLARADGQHGAVNGAHALLGRITGHVKDRLDVTVTTSEMTTEQHVEAMLANSSPEDLLSFCDRVSSSPWRPVPARPASLSR